MAPINLNTLSPKTFSQQNSYRIDMIMESSSMCEKNLDRDVVKN